MCPVRARRNRNSRTDHPSPITLDTPIRAQLRERETEPTSSESVQKSMGHQVPQKTGILTRLPTTSRPLIPKMFCPCLVSGRFNGVPTLGGKRPLGLLIFFGFFFLSRKFLGICSSLSSRVFLGFQRRNQESLVVFRMVLHEHQGMEDQSVTVAMAIHGVFALFCVCLWANKTPNARVRAEKWTCWTLTTQKHRKNQSDKSDSKVSPGPGVPPQSDTE